MKSSEFRRLLLAVFGPTLGPALLREQVLPGLDNHTGEVALAAGVEPRDVWHALCDTMDVPDALRWGLAGKQHVPARSR